MKLPILYSFKRCPYAMRARMALKLADIKCELREIRLNNKPDHMLKVSPKGTVPVLILEDRIIDESMEIVNWVISLENIFDNAISKEKIELFGKSYEAEHFKLKSKDPNLPDDKKLNFDIWLDKSSGLILKVKYSRMGDWEYRLKNFE